MYIPCNSNIRLHLLSLIFFQFTFLHLLSAQVHKEKEPKTIVGTYVSDTLRSDSSKVVEDAPLDIAQNRGLFIVTLDRKMQLRLLGSVRYLIVFDDTELIDKNSFSTFDISTGDQNLKIPNYFNGLNQTRIGFEVTRSTPGGGCVYSTGDRFCRPKWISYQACLWTIPTISIRTDLEFVFSHHGSACNCKFFGTYWIRDFAKSANTIFHEKTSGGYESRHRIGIYKT